MRGGSTFVTIATLVIFGIIVYDVLSHGKAANGILSNLTSFSHTTYQAIGGK